jgi:squalene-associated FAD-dependent desaturase
VNIAVIGAGYAGLAAAAELAARGVPVTVFEASRTLGGRARRLEKDGLVLDNGQHILVGAYTELLRLMRLVGADADALLQHLPLSLVFPGHMELRAPRLPAPLHLAVALFTARGLPFAARLAALRFMRSMKRSGFRLAADMPLAALLDVHEQPGALRRYLWEPLCISALNTPPAEASAQVFLNVLRDSLAASRAASDLLLPRTDFSALFPEPAERFIQARGGEVLRGTPIHGIARQDAAFRLTGDPQQRDFTHVVAAVAPYHLADLVAKLPELEAAASIVRRFDYQPILTCYLRYAQPVSFPAPMVGIAGGTAHFLFTRSLPETSHGLVTAVISADGPHLELPREELVARIHAEVQGIAGRLPEPDRVQVVTEKRATFACRPGVARPQAATPLRNFFLCGDYVASDYPATLESAVRSGAACARLVAGSI